MYRQYLIKSAIFFILVMLVVAGINFTVDPGEIYLHKILADKQSAEFSKKLFNSKYGIVQTGWNERLIKTTLAREAGKFDCIFLGSSHIMQVSSVRNTGNINTQCKNLLNLGVSGGSIEDISIFSYLILNNFQLPNQVFIGIDPWTLKFGMDGRFGAYINYYNIMNKLLKNKKEDEGVSYLNRLIQNLFNGEYLYYSMKLIVKNKKPINAIFKKEIIFPEYQFLYANGYDEVVTLSDGSHVHDKTWILNQKKKNATIGSAGSDYKIIGEIYDALTLKYLKKLITLYNSNGVKVNLVLTPYHPSVFKNGETKSVIHFKEVEKVIKNFSVENSIKIYGSYFPDILECKGEEFYDVMHATNECLNRIDFSK